MHAHTVALAAHEAAAVTPPHAHGSVLVLAAIFGAVGLTLWAFKYRRRLSCWLIAFATGICAVGISVWSDALVALVTTPFGIVALVVTVAVSGMTFYLVAVHDTQGRKIRKAKKDKKAAKKAAKKAGQAYDDEGDVGAELALVGGKEILIPRRHNQLDHRSHYHHLGAPAVAAIFGTSFALLVITFGLIMTDLWQSFTSLGSTVATQSDRVSSGKATAAAAAGHGMSPGHIALIGLAILLVVLYAGHRIEKWRTRPKGDNGEGGGNGGGRRKRRNRGGGGGQRTTPQQMGWH